MLLHRRNNTDALIRRLRQCGCLLVMFILVFATWRRYSNWPAIFDISLWDETGYMNMGRSRSFNLANYEGSPLYGLYYDVISRFLESDAIRLFFVSGLILQIIMLSIIGLAVWILSRSIAVATLVFGLILCSPFLLSSIRSSYLAVALVLLGSSLASLDNCVVNRLALTMLVVLVICFIRPEFVLTFYLAIGALLVVSISRTVRDVYKAAEGRIQVEAQNIYRLAAYLFLTGLLCLAWSFPSLQGGGRAMLAFGQWYAVYWVGAHNSLLDPYLNYKSIMEKVFSSATTPIQAVLSNPAEWIRFTVHNLLRVIPTMRSLVLVRENVILATALLALLSVAAWSMHYRARHIGLSAAIKGLPLVEAGLYAFAPFTVAVLIQPEPRYVLILLAALMCYLVAVGKWHP
jgi:hypothetical protein